MKPFKPMLAATFDGELRHDDYVLSPKLDGIRCIIRDGQPVSRSLKVIRNRFVQGVLGHPEISGFDGELIVGKPTDPDVYRNTNSGVMAELGTPDFSFHVFDVVPEQPDTPFHNRLKILKQRHKFLPSILRKHIEIVPQVQAPSLRKVEVEEEYFIAMGYEGVMLRRLSSIYKFGRATKTQGELLKVKRFDEDEAVIVGFEPLMRNDNEATTNALGYTARSTHQSGKVAQELLGNIVVEDVKTGVRFSVGSGFDLAERKEIWENQEHCMGRLVKYQHFPIGRKDLPRFPTFKGFRSVEDMS